jgi:hypothetical protein
MAQTVSQVLAEADAYFMGRSRLHDAARELARIFEQEGIAYAISEAIALGVHGRVRLTEVPREHADRLEQYVRAKYAELWELAQ